MPIDHSLTYKSKSLKNIPHRIRLSRIIKLIETKKKINSFIDVGCSNGFLTNTIKEKLSIPKVKGVDFDKENLLIASKNYQNIDFSYLNLNQNLDNNEKYDLVTCLETLEHVGNIKQALKNLLPLKSSDGIIIISVPIEIFFWGTLKFLLKTNLYKYTLDELGKIKYSEYLRSLLKGENISRYRDPAKSGFGTHFGFDYREIDTFFKSEKIRYKAFNSFTTRFYVLN